MPEYGGSLDLAVSQRIKSGNLSTITAFWEQKGSAQVQNCHSLLLFKINFVAEQFRGNQILGELEEAGSKK